MTSLSISVGGTERREGWVVISNDANYGQVDIVSDARALPIKSSAVGCLYSSHMLEHLTYADGYEALLEWKRVLVPGGVLKLGVPDVEGIAGSFSLDPWTAFQMLYGGQDLPWNVHRSGYSFYKLYEVLISIGFSEVVRVPEFGLFDDWTSRALIAGKNMSLNVEARTRKMTLADLFNRGYKTDKDTNPETPAWRSHSYIHGFYDKEFTPRREEVLKIVEIGVLGGGSIKLWRDWFVNSTIIGMDNDSQKEERVGLFYIENAIIMVCDAYSPKTVGLFADESIDYVIDDGLHTLESQVASVKMWFPKIKKGGKLIIEDVDELEKRIPVFNSFGISYETVDLRANRGRCDDVLLVFGK